MKPYEYMSHPFEASLVTWTYNPLIPARYNSFFLQRATKFVNNIYKVCHFNSPRRITTLN
eukprot:c16987_g1_i1 orf=264-443(+)